MNSSSVAQFDEWASSIVEEIDKVDRSVWDVFARRHFINFLLSEGVLVIQQEDDGTILLIETEEKISPEIGSESALQAS